MLACALRFGSRSRAKEELEHTSTSPTAETAATTAAAGTTTERHVGFCVVVIEEGVCRRRCRRVKGALGFDMLGRTGLGAPTPKTLIPIFFWLESGQGFLPLGTRGWWGIGGKLGTALGPAQCGDCHCLDSTGRLEFADFNVCCSACFMTGRALDFSIRSIILSLDWSPRSPVSLLDVSHTLHLALVQGLEQPYRVGRL